MRCSRIAYGFSTASLKAAIVERKRMIVSVAMNLTCVKCTSVLDKAGVGDVEVDLCPSCGGLWLDHGEIERIGRGKPAELDSLKKALTGSEKPDEASETTTSCPACPGQLKEVVLGPV